MNTQELLKNVGKRTGGDVYLGVVGPVRTGKSTFIKKFMEHAVIPYIKGIDEKTRMTDELPQSSEGRTIMTTEPKFVPNQAATIEFDDGFHVNVRLVDCVGYVISEAKGYRDENGERMIRTPWLEEAIPFHEAAKIGTQKVIQDHSTIGIVMTTDGTIVDLPREAYVEAEMEVIEELQRINKPFIIIVNSRRPSAPEAVHVVEKLKEKYDVPVLALACNQLQEEDVLAILREALYEFPISEIQVNMPKWLMVLSDEHWLKQSIQTSIADSMQSVNKLKEVESIITILKENEYIDTAHMDQLDPGTGIVDVDLDVDPKLYHTVLKEIIGTELHDKADLLSFMQEVTEAKKEYDSISSAWKMVKQAGYGYASCSLEEIKLSKPELIKQQNRYGIRLHATAPSVHMIKVDAETTFEPIIGSKEQSDALIQYLLRDDQNDPMAIWDSDIFGRKLSEIIQDGLRIKMSNIPQNARMRLQTIVAQLVNKGKGNVIAIVI